MFDSLVDTKSQTKIAEKPGGLLNSRQRNPARFQSETKIDEQGTVFSTPQKYMEDLSLNKIRESIYKSPSKET